MSTPLIVILHMLANKSVCVRKALILMLAITLRPHHGMDPFVKTQIEVF